jgi:polar amino acid transport system substrate-binding protein
MLSVYPGAFWSYKLTRRIRVFPRYRAKPGCIAGLGLFAALLTSLSTSLSAVAAPTEYTVAVESIDYMPLYDGSNKDAYRGYARDLLDLFARKFGYKFSYVPLPINRLYKEFFVTGNYDFKFPDNPNWQQETKAGRPVIYSAPVITLNEGIFVPAPRLGKGLESIKSIATITGFTPTPYLSAINSGKIKLYSVDTFRSLFTMSMINRVDGIYTNNFSVQYFQSTSSSGKIHLEMDTSLPKISSSFLLSTLKHPLVVQQFNQFLHDEHAEIMALGKRYHVLEDATIEK